MCIRDSYNILRPACLHLYGPIRVSNRLPPKGDDVGLATGDGFRRNLRRNEIRRDNGQPARCFLKSGSPLGKFILTIRGKPFSKSLIAALGDIDEICSRFRQQLYNLAGFFVVKPALHVLIADVYKRQTYTIEKNVNAIYFAEQEAGFLAGYAAVKNGFTKLGFIGGMALPAMTRFGYGYVYGADYAARERCV